MLKKGTERGQVTDKLRTVYRKAVESGKAADRLNIQTVIDAADAYAAAAQACQDAFLFTKAAAAWKEAKRYADYLCKCPAYRMLGESILEQYRYGMACMLYFDGSRAAAKALMEAGPMSMRKEVFKAVCDVCCAEDLTAKAAAGFLLEICTSTNGYASRGRVGQSGFWEQYLFSEAVTALLKMLQTDTGRHVFDHVFPHTDTADTLSERLLSIADSALTDPRVRSRMAKP